MAIRNLKSGQTDCYSIHKEAELATPPGLAAHALDEYERALLTKLFKFFEAHRDSKWVHWNMRDANYGFHALERRHEILNGKLFSVPDDSKFDLSRALVAIYGVAYTPHPRLKTIMEANHITSLDFLNGADEAAAFARGQYAKVSASTSRKADVLAGLAQRAADGDLKVRGGLLGPYGRSFPGFIDLVRDHWFFVLLSAAASVAGVAGLIAAM